MFFVAVGPGVIAGVCCFFFLLFFLRGGGFLFSLVKGFKIGGA